jgi:uncharacterized protein YukE
MTMSGADVAALRELARSLRRRQQEIDAGRRRLAAIMDTLPWSGSDHDRFVADWRVHDSALTSIATEMSQASGRADRYADRQERASRPSS